MVSISWCNSKRRRKESLCSSGRSWQDLVTETWESTNCKREVTWASWWMCTTEIWATQYVQGLVSTWQHQRVSWFQFGSRKWRKVFWSKIIRESRGRMILTSQTMKCKEAWFAHGLTGNVWENRRDYLSLLTPSPASGRKNILLQLWYVFLSETTKISPKKYLFTLRWLKICHHSMPKVDVYLIRSLTAITNPWIFLPVTELFKQ